MHIAICDDNIADRKQLERLLGRESDKRKQSTGVFYTDSFGDSIILRQNPMSYDLFFIDLTLGKPNGLSFALQLQDKGVTAPIVLCISKIDYQLLMSGSSIGTKLPDSTAKLMFLQKPIQVKALSSILDDAVHMLENRVPTIELRSDHETCYVREDEIVCAVSAGMYVNVTLKNGAVISILSDMKNFYSTVNLYTHYVLLSKGCLVNIVYLEKYNPFSVTLKNQIRLKSSPAAVSDIKYALEMLQKELLSNSKS